ncbi:hypothetical protein [Kineococcus terrestris]|uniref:hypothetical protein n=1 Tax=Kineococcus terrestris TaxID=2044856 RepID=UPI0034DAE54E
MIDKARRHSLIAFVVRIVAVVVAVIALEATVPDLGRWWRSLIAALISLISGLVTEEVLRRRGSSAGAEGRPPR